MIDQSLLEILVCPENKTPLTVADDAIVSTLNQRIEAGTLVNRGGDKVEKQIEGGLIREDRAYLYIVRDDIPIMLIDEAVPLSQV
ncbi:MAG: hypothetical protein HYV27_24170 [Candidatus Hydrogenedentes bacterium]|nr:hypothetical protein [Candidatus Hydrogenedentota bacterium]